MLDQAAFAHSVETHLESLTAEEVRALVLRSIKRMDGAHRSQLALFLGHEVGADPIDEVGGSPLHEQQLRAYVESSTLLRERFAAFLRENPRAAIALGIVDRDEARVSPLRKLPPKTAAIAALALVLAFLPLAAQYVHQRGALSGLGQISLLPPAPAAPPRARLQREPARRAIHHAAAPRTQHHVRSKKRALALHAAHRRGTERRIAAAPVRAVHRTHAAAPWKFDPRYNPYFNRGRWHVAYHEATHAAPHAAPVDAFARRARIIVEGYLADVVAGNTAGALRHLGLPEHADIGNVRESPIISRHTRVRVVAVSPQPGGGAKVEADINGPSGEYFEVFYVARDGPAARITDRYYIPVNRTAEERAARLLAKDGRS